MLIIAALVTLLIVIATVLPLFKNPHWIIRSMDFPRLQITCLAGLLLCVHFIFLDLQESVTWFLLVASAMFFLAVVVGFALYADLAV